MKIIFIFFFRFPIFNLQIIEQKNLKFDFQN